MGRKRTGTYVRDGDALRLRIPITAIRDGKTATVRIWAAADPTLSDDEAEALAKQMTEHFSGRVVDPQEVYRALRGEQVTTIRDFVKQVYLPTRADQSSFPRQKQWWDRRILPVIGNADVRTFDADTLRRLVENLDQRVADPGTRFAWKTAWNVWELVTRFCSDLAHSKDRRIRIRKTNPGAGVRGPDRGDKSVKQWLYPSELRRLLDCDRVPLERRRRWALLVYFFARAGEVHGLTWANIDLEHGIVTIDRARELRTGEVGPTKTHDVRVFPIEPILLPMLRAMKDEGAAFSGSEDGAKELRRDLRDAGVTREELHQRRAPSVPITQHDLRATGITYLAMRGESDDGIRERAGHTDFKMTQVYIRRGRRLVGAALNDPFGPLPDSLLGASNDPGEPGKPSNQSSTPLDGSPDSSTGTDSYTYTERGLVPLESASNTRKTSTYAVKAALQSLEKSTSVSAIDDIRDDKFEPLEAAERRVERVSALAALDPSAAPDLALCRGLAKALRGHDATEELGEAADALQSSGGSR